MPVRARCTFALASTLGLASTCAGAAEIVTLDPGPGMGKEASIMLGPFGDPVVAHRYGGDGSAWLALCGEPDCRYVETERVEDASGAYAKADYLSVFLDRQGRMLLATYDFINDNPVLARCAATGCDGEAELRTVRSHADNDGMDIVGVLGANNRPLLAWRNQARNALEVAACTTPLCFDYTLTELHDDPTNAVAVGLDLALDADGVPVMAYLDTTADLVHVARCLQTDCSNGATIATIAQNVPSAAGNHPALVIGHDGNPVIAYYAGDALAVTSCQDPACQLTVTTVLVDQGADHDAGYYPSIGVRPNGNPVLAWQFRALDSEGGSGLRLGDCSTPTCAGDVRITTVDYRPGEITGTDTDLVVGADGAVYVAYYDVTTSSLRLARCSPESCAGPAQLEVFGSGFEALF